MAVAGAAAAAASAAVVAAAALDSLLGEKRLLSDGKAALAALRDGLSPCTCLRPIALDGWEDILDGRRISLWQPHITARRLRLPMESAD